MNVLPKKRVQQFTQYLTLSRNVSLQRGVSALKKAALAKKFAPSLLRNVVSKMSLPHRNLKLSSLHGISTSFTSVISYRFVWFSVWLAMYGWFMYWIATDILVLHIPITRVSPTNYLGALVSMALIWGGNMIFKPSPSAVLELVKKPQEPTEQKAPRKRKARKPKIASSTTIQLEPLPPVQPQFKVAPEPHPDPPIAKKPRKRKTVAANAKCTTRIVSSLEIPDECLTCTNLVTCLSNIGTKRSRVGRAGFGPATFGS
jgi:hypothetical protein